MKQIGTARPLEPPDALERCKEGAWAGDRYRLATPAPVGRWPELTTPMPRPRPWGAWKRRREAA